VSLSGVVQLFAGRPVHPVGPDGRMALSDHLRELRGRILKISLVLLAAFVAGLFFFDQLFDLVIGPYHQAQETLGEDVTIPTVSGPGGPFLLYFKLCGLGAVIGTSVTGIVAALTLDSSHHARQGCPMAGRRGRARAS